MIGLLDVPADARRLLTIIASGHLGQLTWFSRPLTEWYAGVSGSHWHDHRGRPVWAWYRGAEAIPEALLAAPATVAALRALQECGLVTEETPALNSAQPVLLTSDGKAIVNWLAFKDGWMPHGAQ